MALRKKKKDPEQTCRFCVNAKLIGDDDMVLCTKKGIVKSDYTCKKFTYDLLKRNPGRQLSVASIEFVDLDD